MDKKPEEAKEGAPEWMTTYGDMVTLLMCFFVLLFAFSEIDAQKFEAVMQSFQGSAGILSGGTTLDPSDLAFKAMPEKDVSSQSQEIEELQELKEKVSEVLEKLELETEVSLELEDRGLIIRFKNDILFDSGKSDIRKDAEEVLRLLGNILIDEEFSRRLIRIEGHTDNVPISTSRFPSNWELSLGRATSVLKFFLYEVGIPPERMSPAGYSEYRPLDGSQSNETAEGRAKNRRVDIVVMRGITEEQEPVANGESE